MHIGDRGLVEKIAEMLLTLPQRLVRLAELLAHPALDLFQVGDLPRSQSQLHLSAPALVDIAKDQSVEPSVSYARL